MGNTASNGNEDEMLAWMLVNLKKSTFEKAINFEGQEFEENDMVYFPSPPDGTKTDGVIVSTIDKEHAVVRYHAY